MKMKKYGYILVFVLMILMGMGTVYAADAVTCEALFDADLRELIDELLTYPKIIVPVLVIVLGMLDLGKAVIASKEDEMRKAQATFIKRVILGVVIFFVPVIVNVLMDIADAVWTDPTIGLGTGCRL